MRRSSGSEPRRPVAGEHLLHPAVLLAIATLLVNDHVLKSAWPGALTGKLSDIAGLVFFPVFLQALWELAFASAQKPWSHSQRVLCSCAALTSAVFVFAKTSALGASIYRSGLGVLGGLPGFASDWFHGEAARLPLARFTQDPSDVLALPAVLVGVWLFRQVARER